MASSPVWKVYTPGGEYTASFKHPEDAAVLVAFLGDGATIRHAHKLTVWKQGVDGDAAESYDAVAEKAYRSVDRART